MRSLILVSWRNMENTGKLEAIILPVLAECNVRLYEMKWTGGKDKVLEISIMNEDGSMDLDTCAEVSEKISEALDASDLINEAYTLEVCSPGAEREIRELSELERCPYIYVRLKHPFKKMLELTGQVLSYEGGLVTLEYRDKAAKKKAEFEDSEIEYVRYAVKF